MDSLIVPLVAVLVSLGTLLLGIAGLRQRREGTFVGSLQEQVTHYEKRIVRLEAHVNACEAEQDRLRTEIDRLTKAMIRLEMKR